MLQGKMSSVLAVVSSLVMATQGKDVRLLAGRTDVVIDSNACSVVRFAAAEATNFLSQALGGTVPVVHAPVPGRTAVILGTNAWSVAAGLHPETLARDGFSFKAGDGQVFLAGCDSPDVDMTKALADGYWAQVFERATLFAVYDFLERFAGVRFYFPGELGTIVPRRKAVEVPAGRRDVVPNFTRWSYSTYWDGAWIGEDPVKVNEAGRATTIHPGKTLNLWRLRASTFYVPYAHGLNQFYYLKRFGETHPEYFQMYKGKRRLNPREHHAGQLCHSSGVNEEIYRDVKSYLMGEHASVRGIPGKKPGEFAWNRRNPYGKTISVMPQDGMTACECPNCQAAYSKTDKTNYATELIWSNTVRLAERLKADGLEGFTLTQMAYCPYRRIPDFPLPSNIDVEVAESGPWAKADPARMARDNDEVRRWSEKLGHRIALWNYPCKVFCLSLLMPNVPQMTPHAWGEYYKSVSKWSTGAFAESESDRFFFNHLNYYLYSRVAWDADTDVDAVIEEYHRLMFGAAAPHVKAVYDELERKWLYEIAGRMRDTPLGPAAMPPTEHELWTVTYGPEVLASFRARFDRAASVVPAGSIESRRIALVRSELLGSLERGSSQYMDVISVEKELARRAARPDAVSLVSNKGFIRAVHDKEVFVIPPSSIKVVSTNRSQVVTHLLSSGISRLKPSTRYRLSYFVKTLDVRPVGKKGGASACLFDERNRNFPSGGVCGTVDWLHRSFEFVTSPLTNEKKQAFLRVGLYGATGTAWFDGVRLEEIGE